MELQNQLLADHFADPYHRGECEHANFASEGSAAESGCELRIELIIAENKIEQAWFDSDGCPVCESIASVMMEAVEGKHMQEVTRLTLDVLLNTAGASAIDDTSGSACSQLPLSVLRQAIKSPLDGLDDDLTDGTTFGGPSLREEC